VNFFYSFGILDLFPAVLRSLMLTMLYLSMFYLNYLSLISGFLNRKKMWLYFLILLAVILTGTFLRLRMERLFVNENLPGLAKIPIQRIGFAAGTIVVLLLLSTAYRLLVDHLKADDQRKEMIKQKTEAELKFLKTQVNPHFLFNTLNNLYALAYSGSEQTAPGIMALSQMMRYILYETDKERVTLEKEVSFLMNYIDLEKLRVENATAVHIEVQENLHDILVAPLVFIPFVENSFKHSRIIDDPKAWIEIKLRSEPGKIISLCSKSIPKNAV
jgi:sensor histidine kinase YesM